MASINPGRNADSFRGAKCFLSSLEYQPVLIVSVGGREPSGDSGHTFLSSDGMWVEYIHWSLTRKNVR